MDYIAMVVITALTFYHGGDVSEGRAHSVLRGGGNYVGGHAGGWSVDIITKLITYPILLA